MEPVTAQRTLVKSRPELWAKLSDVAQLARHLEEGFGEIRITRLEDERTVAWKGERACGTVELETSGWGTKVTLTAEPSAPDPGPSPPPSPARRTGPQRSGFLARLLGRRRPIEEPPPAVSVAEPQGERASWVLETVLDDLGAAHQRPFSRG